MPICCDAVSLTYDARGARLDCVQDVSPVNLPCREVDVGCRRRPSEMSREVILVGGVEKRLRDDDDVSHDSRRRPDAKLSPMDSASTEP